MANLKKWTVILLVIIVFFPSCITKEYYEEQVNIFTKDYTVKKAHWNIGTDDDSGDYYYYEFQEPNLTRYIYDNGVMQAFLLMNDENLTPLPFDDFWDVGNYIRTEQTTCEFRPGYITFILKYNDHSDDTPYYDYTFRVRFMW